MTTLLHIDSSARTGLSGRDRHGSHTRRLTARFVQRWVDARPGARVIRRDIAANPPAPVTEDWIGAAFTPTEERTAAMTQILAESDMLVEEVIAADVIVIGAPMYNFGVPSPLKAWIDNVVRVGRTFGFDRTRQGDPYWPMLPAGKTLVILSARGDGGYDAGGALAETNLVERSLTVPLAYTGITDVHMIAAEWDEFADARIAESLRSAESMIDALVADLAGEGRSRAA